MEVSLPQNANNTRKNNNKDDDDDDNNRATTITKNDDDDDHKRSTFATLWKNVVDADKTRDSNAITAAVFSFLMHRLDTEANLTTGTAIFELEHMFRSSLMNTHCVARKTVDPYRSCAYDKQPTPYHLFLIPDSRAHVREEYHRQGTTSPTQNLERLQQCGFLENATEAVAKERRMKAVRLPDDLDTTTLEHQRLFDVPSLSYFARDADDALSLRNKCLQHASASQQGVVSDALSFSGLQVVRTSVPIEMWQKTRDAIRNQMRERLAIAESKKAAIDPKIQVDVLKKVQEQVRKDAAAAGKTQKESDNLVLSAMQEAQQAMQREADARTCIKECLIPVGYQLLGATREPPHVRDGEQDDRQQVFALFELYCVTERKYHIAMDDAEYNWLCAEKAKYDGNNPDDRKTVSESQLRAMLAKKVDADVGEMNGITFANLRRHVHIEGRGAMPC